MLVRIKYFFLLLALLGLSSSCNYFSNSKNSKLLDEAARIMADNVQQALSILQSVDRGSLSEDDDAYFILLKVRAWESAGKDIATSEQDVVKIKDYFIGVKDYAKTALAYYVLAKVNMTKGDNARTFTYLQMAEEYAAKVDFDIPYYVYAIIPYDIAYILYLDGSYKEAIRYLDEALSLAKNKSVSYKVKLYPLELKACAYKELHNADSAYYYYEQALRVAQANADINSIGRTLTNTSSTFSIVGKQDLALGICNQSISFLIKTNDSLNLGKAYITKAIINYYTDNTDSALVYIYKAKNLLVDVDYPTQLSLYNTLCNIEKEAGNKANYEKYKYQFDSLQDAQKVKVLAEAKLKSELKKQEGAMLAQSLHDGEKARHVVLEQRKYTHMASGFVAFCLLGLGASLYQYQRSKKTFSKRVMQNTSTEREQLHVHEQDLIEEKLHMNELLETEKKRLLIKEQELNAQLLVLQAKEKKLDAEKMQVEMKVKTASSNLNLQQKRKEKYLSTLEKKLAATRLEIKTEKEELQKIEQSLQERELRLADERLAFEQWQKSLKKSAKVSLIKNVLLRQDMLKLCSYTPNEDASEIVRKINNSLQKTDWEAMYQLFSVNYDALYADLQKDFSTLTELELKICYLFCTQIIKHHEIVAVLNLPIKEFDEASNSMKQKLEYAGYSSNQLKEYAQKYTLLLTDNLISA